MRHNGGSWMRVHTNDARPRTSEASPPKPKAAPELSERQTQALDFIGGVYRQCGADAASLPMLCSGFASANARDAEHPDFMRRDLAAKITDLAGACEIHYSDEKTLHPELARRITAFPGRDISQPLLMRIAERVRNG